MNTRHIVLILSLMFFAGVARATIILVPEDYTSIELAVADAESNDEISISSVGSPYYESNMVLKNGMKIYGRTGRAEDVVINVNSTTNPIMRAQWFMMSKLAI